jgi:hypothetical protein
MGCCGEKRREYRVAGRKKMEDNSTPMEKTSLQEKNLSNEFMYVGKRSLKVRGASSGTIYYFRFPGYRIQVANEDIYGLMGEAELKAV